MIPDLALIEARRAVMLEDPAACVRAYESIEARYGYGEASRAWRTACREADARAEAWEPPVSPVAKEQQR